MTKKTQRFLNATPKPGGFLHRKVKIQGKSTPPPRPHPPGKNPPGSPFIRRPS